MLNKEVLYIEYDPDTVDGEGLHTTLDCLLRGLRIEGPNEEKVDLGWQWFDNVGSVEELNRWARGPACICPPPNKLVESLQTTLTVLRVELDRRAHTIEEQARQLRQARARGCPCEGC